MTKKVLLCVVLASLFSVRAAIAQQIAVSASTVAPGQPVTVTVTGPPGHLFAVIGSSVNAGFSYGGVPLAVGADVVILSIGTLNSNGVGVVSFTPPFVGTQLDRYYIQAVTSTSPDFVPPTPGPSVVIRNADLVEGLFGRAFRSTTGTVTVPAGSFVVQGIVQIGNNTGAEFATTCFVVGDFSGVSYPAAVFVPANRTDTIPLLAAITTTAPTTLSVSCALAPPPGVGFTPALVATQVGSITQTTP